MSSNQGTHFERYKVSQVAGARRVARRLLVLDRDAVPCVDTPGIRVQPAYEWLLAEPGHGEMAGDVIDGLRELNFVVARVAGQGYVRPA